MTGTCGIIETSKEIAGRFYLPTNNRTSARARISLDKSFGKLAGERFFVSMKTPREWRVSVYHVSEHESFYDSDEWRKLRRDVFYRDHYRCLRCDKRFKTEELNAHHMTPREDGGADDKSNLVSLCNACHDFVEIHGLRNKASIIGSLENERVVIEKVTRRQDKIIDDGRPEWHKYVYGGVKRPRG